METTSADHKPPRIPDAWGDIQVNFCKNPACKNFGIPASQEKQPRGRYAEGKERDTYTIASSREASSLMLKCGLCGEYPTIKSNRAIYEELAIISEYLKPATITCPNENCINHTVDISTGKSNYHSFGRTKSGSQRYRCKLCRKLFSVGGSTWHQKKPQKNLEIFRLLVNKMPFKRICEAADISMPSLYDKIEFLHRQCLAFVGHREIKLKEGLPIKRVYVGADWQDYIVNWSNSVDKRNIMLHAIGSADNNTGYVFGLHLNFDPSLDAAEIEAAAKACGDYEIKVPFRRYARVWLREDYYDSLKNRLKLKKSDSHISLRDDIASAYEEALSREDIEVFETQELNTQLPRNGMQVHAEYTLYGHFFLLRNLFSGVEKVRFFLDQDSGMRAACLGAFTKEIRQGRCDAFYVRINRDSTIDERKRMVAECRRELERMKKKYPAESDSALKLMIIKKRMKEVIQFGKWQDKWIYHPFPNLGEPEKAVCYLTDIQNYDEDHLAWLYNKASLHAINRFFMQVRRRLSLVERPIATPSRAGRRWHGYNAYNPAVITKLLDIFRVFYNYVETGGDRQTPATRLGLAKSKVDMEDIIYYA